MPQRVLVTGAAGYIGSHVLVALGAAGQAAVSLDNYSNSSPAAIDRVNALTDGSVEAVELDIANTAGLRKLLRAREIDSVIHMAGLKSVAESVAQPMRYHLNNVEGTRRLLEALRDSGIRNFVFSSSACVYAISETQPMDESAPLGPYNPYGQNKLDIEIMLRELAVRDPTWRIAILRYFNPVGAHESGTIGEDPSGIPNNLMPFVCQVAAKRRERLSIFGTDYPTPDGTGVRDYIHVMDLAEGHVAALAQLARTQPGTVLTLNLGTGRPHSVLELVTAFERANGLVIPRDLVARRPGDIARYYANPALAERALGWKANRGLEEMCRDAWRWQSRNPAGYGRA